MTAKKGFVFIPIIIIVLVFSAIAAITITKFLKNNPFSSVALTAPTAPTSPTSPALPDADRDGFSDDIENAIGTSPILVCTSGNYNNFSSYPGSPSKHWPADVHTLKTTLGDGMNRINLQDITSFVAPVRRLDTKAGDPNFAKRYDLDNNGVITTADINLVKRAMNKTCSAPI